MTGATKRGLIGCLLLCASLPGRAAAQFRDDFDGGAPQPGWTWFTGDGLASIDFKVRDGHGVMLIDATRDRDNIWWALIKRNVASSLDLATLAQSGHALRLEARVRVHETPRRVHLQINTQKTTDYDYNLREFDLADTLWHTISMTSHDLGAGPGDSVNIQVGYTDAGLGRYAVDVDYMRADVVDVRSAPPDVGAPIVYHPPPAHDDPAAFGQHLDASQSAMVDERYPSVSFGSWHEAAGGDTVRLLNVSGSRYAILRWDLRPFAGRTVAGNALLELTTRSLQLGPNDPEEFGQVRVTEILGGDPSWDQGTVTLDRLLGGRPFDEVVNPQMLSDYRVVREPGAVTRIAFSRAAMQRLLDGRTRGLLIRALGPVDASFYAGDRPDRPAPRLHFDLAPQHRAGR